MVETPITKESGNQLILLASKHNYRFLLSTSLPYRASRQSCSTSG